MFFYFLQNFNFIGIAIEDVMCTMAASGRKQSCYLLYQNQLLATQALESLKNQVGGLFKKPIYVEWADPQPEPSDTSMSYVT